MSGLFGGKDPFDDPFFSRPFGSLFGSSMSGSTAPPFGDSAHSNKSRAPIIEELDCEDENNLFGEEEDSENSMANRNPLIEHPDDHNQADDDKKSKVESKSKKLTYRSDRNKVEAERPQKGGVSFQRVSYGGINGAYYAASTARRTGSDGVVLEERKEADSTTGQAAHRISKGIHDKGHSVTRKLNSEGKVDTVQTLHNLDEDELAGFEQLWKGNDDMHLPVWDNEFGLHSRPGIGSRLLTSWSGSGVPFREQFRRDAGPRPDADAQAHSARGRPKKVVRIPIE